MLARLAHWIAHHRLKVILIWLVLTMVGAGYSASAVSDRWLQTFSIPGAEAYEANMRTLDQFGTGAQAPIVVVLTSESDVTKDPAVEAAVERATEVNAGARTSSYFSTGSDAYVSDDRRTTFVQFYPPGVSGFESKTNAEATRKAIDAGLPASVTSHVTGQWVLYEENAEGTGGEPSLLLEALVGGLGALIILFFVFGTLPAIAIPLIIAFAAIMNTFTLVLALTYVTDVSIIVSFLIGLVGLGVAIDYALLMIFRFRDELREGEDVETALVETMTHAGRSVIVSGSTVAVGLLSMIVLPLPFIRSMGIAGMLIPAVSVLASITLLPALLAMFGQRINSIPVMPRRFIDRGHPEDGPWGRWARLVNRRPGRVALIGLAVSAVLVGYGLQLNPGSAEIRHIPAAGDAAAGRAALTDAGISHGVMIPFDILVEKGGDPEAVAAAVRGVEGVAGAAAPPDWRKGEAAIVEAFSSVDGNADETRATMSRIQDALEGTNGTLAGPAAEERDFVNAVWDNFPYVLAFVIVLTFLLLARAFRSFVLPLKAVILNLVSLGAAFGVVVFIFQQGHGSEAIWDVNATQAISAWIPLMIFAFLYGLSMDYEVFMISRIREAYDETGSTEKAIELGLARTGKLVTSAALVLMFSFIVLSTGPGFELKQFAIGLAAGIIIDATLIRALLVPAIMRLLGNANWWFPAWAAKLLRAEKPDVPPAALESA